MMQNGGANFSRPSMGVNGYNRGRDNDRHGGFGRRGGFGGGYGGGYGIAGLGYGYGYNDGFYDQDYADSGYGYGYDQPLYGPGVQYSQEDEAPLQTGRSVAAIGDSCATPVKVCTLYNQSYVGSGCSCKVPGGRSHGRVVP